jgi:hypothetical protein
VAHIPAGIAWHPSPSQTPGTVQLVTGSADKTARLFSGEGKQLGSLQVTFPLQFMVDDIKLQCCQVVYTGRACPEGSPLLRDLVHVLFCLDKQPRSTAIDCTKHMTADPLFSTRQQQVVSVYTWCHALHAYKSAVDHATL